MLRPYLAVTAAALACAATSGAAAYSLNPPDINAHLRGTVIFHPDGLAPFKCKITMLLTTRQVVTGVIKSVKLDPGYQCNGLVVGDPPWGITLFNTTSGQLGPFNFDRPGHGQCHQDDLQFQVNGSGVWSFPPGQCMSGSLDSHPPVTIVQ